MKRKIITLAIVVLILIMPAVIAISSYIYSQNNPVTKGSVTKIVMSMPTGDEITFIKGKKESATVYDCLFSMNANAKGITALPSDASSYKVFKVKYSSYNKVSEYTYYLTSDPDNCFYRDHENKLYHISKKSAAAFLKTKYATEIFPDATQPVLNVGTSANVLPSSITWKYLATTGKFVDGNIKTDETKPTCNVSGGLQLSFDIVPDYIYAVMKDSEGKTVFDDVYENIDPTLFANNTVYDVKLIAKWYQTPGGKNYGEAEYNFTANVLSPAVFYMSEHATLRYGDFVIVSAKNIVDPSQIGFSSQPSLDVTPMFFEYGGYYHALIPFSLGIEKTNNKELNYVFTFTYGDISQDIPVTLTARAYGKDAQDIPLDTILEKRNETTIAKFNETVAPYLNAHEDKLYWMTDNLIIDPTTRKIRSGFGIDIILSYANNEVYEHEGVNYYVKKGDSVSVCLPGKVVFVGETTLSGKTVIVEHGGGLKSLYAHMSSISVTVGQEIGKGTVIGIVGDTGFCTGTTLHFGLYIYGTPVRYYNYETEGVSVNSIVAKAIGLSK